MLTSTQLLVDTLHNAEAAATISLACRNTGMQRILTKTLNDIRNSSNPSTLTCVLQCAICNLRSNSKLSEARSSVRNILYTLETADNAAKYYRTRPRREPYITYVNPRNQLQTPSVQL